jgi:hypothetical protein
MSEIKKRRLGELTYKEYLTTDQGDETVLTTEKIGSPDEIAMDEIFKSYPEFEGKDNVFWRTGDTWLVRFKNGEPFQLKDTKGTHYLTVLLNQPGKELTVIQMTEIVEGQPRLDVVGAVYDERELMDEGLAIKMLTEQKDLNPEEAENLMKIARKACSEFLLAFTKNDMEDKRKKEQQWNEVKSYIMEYGLMPYLTKKEVLRFKPKIKLEKEVDKVRINITKQIRNVISRIKEYEPQLGGHLDVHVKTGGICSYKPTSPIQWYTNINN